MFQKLCCAAALATATTGAADAAVFRYDLTLSLSSISVGPLFGNDATTAPPQASCSDDTIAASCSINSFELLSGGYNSNSDIDSLLTRYEPTLMGTLLLESQGPAGSPQCFGSSEICSVIFGDDLDITASADGFSIRSTDFGGETRKLLTSQGLIIDQVSTITSVGFGNTTFFGDPGTEDSIIYTANDLTITPLSAVPLPAGMMLLPTALAFFGWRRRAARAV